MKDTVFCFPQTIQPTHSHPLHTPHIHHNAQGSAKPTLFPYTRVIGSMLRKARFIPARNTVGGKLLISKQWSAFAVFVDNCATRERIAAQEARDTDGKGQNEEEAANGECKDPLQLQDVRFGEELAYSG